MTCGDPEEVELYPLAGTCEFDSRFPLLMWHTKNRKSQSLAVWGAEYRAWLERQGQDA